MNKIDLFTRTGEYVTTVTIPEFNPKYEVIIWGTRLFLLNSVGAYLEGSAYAVPPELKIV